MDSPSLVADTLPRDGGGPGGIGGLRARASDRDSSKVVMPGTDRARPPAETLPDALRWAGLVGVTRLADVTRLDTIGIPTYQAVRPNSLTLTVSQGKGMTEELARISALMESVELWHAERSALTPLRGTVREMLPRLTYDPYRDLPLASGSMLHDDLPLEWVTAVRLTDGEPVPVPNLLVGLDFTAPQRWQPQVFSVSSNGLASGNTFVEATLHGLYEVIERDAVTRGAGKGAAGKRFDPREVGSAAVADLLDRFAAAEVVVDARWLPSPTGLPCVGVRIVSADYPRVSGGFGCHLRMDVATTRALTEAAQSRAALIAGARDDLARGGYDVVYHLSPSPRDTDRTFDLPPPELLASTSHDSLLADLAEVTSRCAAAFPTPPLVVDLSQPRIGAPVARVIAPGCLLGEDIM